MNGFPRRHGMPHERTASVRLAPAAFVLFLGSVVGCGSNGASPSGSGSSASGTDRNAKSGAESESAAAHAAASRASASSGVLSSVTENEEIPAVQPPEYRLPNPFLCSRDPVAFDLSLLHPAGGTPIGFTGAWSYAQAHSEVPGFMVAYSGTMWGPELTVRVGAVRPAAPGLYTFMASLPGSEVPSQGLNPRDPFLVRTDHLNHNFVTAFGKVKEREGFVISDIIVEGRLDQACQYLRGVVVKMTLPRQNVGQRFGGTTIDEALGPLTVDTDNDGEPDAWGVTLTGDSLDNVMFKL
jgi:hypothetical protein